MLFYNWTSGAQTISIESTKNNACRRLSTNCYGEISRVTLKSFDADKDGVLDPGFGIDGCSDPTGTAQDNLYMLCKCYYNANEDQCRDVCGCKGLAQISEEYPPEVP